MMQETERIDFEQFLADPRSVFDRVRRHHVSMLVERDGETYRLEQEAGDSLWNTYDPVAARQGLRTAVGALDGVNIEELLADLRAQRGQESYGRPA